MVVLMRQFVEHCVGSVHRVCEPAPAVPSLAANRFESRTADGIDEVVRNVQRRGKPAGSAHGRFNRLTYFARAQWASSQTFDDALANGEPNPLHRNARANEH
jgi:hypothetical protein